VCINCSFLHLFWQFYYRLDNISYFRLYSCTCFQAVYIGSVILFIFDNLRYMSYFHNVCTISAILYYSVSFIEIEYFDVREPFETVLANFSLHMIRNSTISTSGLNRLSRRFHRHRFRRIILKFWQFDVSLVEKLASCRSRVACYHPRPRWRTRTRPLEYRGQLRDMCTSVRRISSRGPAAPSDLFRSHQLLMLTG